MMTFAPGENVGAYRIVEQLGSGGMATVFKAYHAALDRYVAIKVLHPAFKGDENFLARFQREARVVAKLDHPNIVPVYDFSEYNGAPYLVMRFVEGETLKARLQREQLTLPEILDVVRPMGEALAYAHEQGVLHRDIKPSNVLLADDGKVFLTDFGLARIVQAGESSLTRDALVGTPYYISPEQAVGKSELDARTDIYSFGVVLYELLTGRVPFQSDTPFAVIHDHIYTPLPLPTSVNPNIPPALERVLLKAMAKEPEDRYNSALEMLDAIEAAVTGVAATPPARVTPPPIPAPTLDTTPPPAETPAPPTRKSRTWVWVGCLVAVIAVAGLALLLLLASRRGDTGKSQVADQPTVEAPTALPSKALSDHLMAARELAEQGDIAGALSEYSQAVEQDRKLADAYIEGAYLLAQQGDLDQAVETLRRGGKARPDHAGLHLALAQVLIADDRWDEALPEIAWLLENAPDLAEAHAYMAVYLSIETGDLTGAQAEIDAALELDPDLPEAHFAQGIVHWKEGRFRLARLALERARNSPRASVFLKARIQFFLDRMDETESTPSP